MANKASRASKIIAEKVDSLPSLPDASDRVLKLLNDQETEIKDVERVIMMDQALTAKVLKLANSRYYGEEGQVTNLSRAISLLGFNTIRSVAVSEGMDQQYSVPESPDFPRDKFWDYSLATGICSEIIGEYLGYSSEKKGELFSAGHLHASGKAVLDQHLHKEFLKILSLVFQKDITMYEAEKEVLDGMTHCELGAEVLDEWGLPDNLVNSARYYYTPQECDMQVVTIVHLASVLTKTKGYGFSGDNNIRYLDEDKVDELDLKQENLQKILKKDLPDKMEKFTE